MIGKIFDARCFFQMHDSLTMLSDGAEFLLITELCFTDKLLIKYKSKPLRFHYHTKPNHFKV